MDPKQRRQWIISLVVAEGLLLFFLSAAGLWPVLIVVLLAEMAVVAAILLRRTGRWPQNVRLGRIGCWVAVFAPLLLLILLLSVGVPLYTDWLWFEEVGFTAVFTTRLGSKVLLFLGGWVVVTLILGGNARLALRWRPRRQWLDEQRASLNNLWLNRVGPWLSWVVAAVVGLAFAGNAQDRWLHVLQFLNGSQVGQTDPLFQRDLGFYFFRLDLLLDAKNVLLWLTVLALGSAALIYLVGQRRPTLAPRPLAHLSVLGILFFLVKAWDYRLKTLLLVYSRNSVAYGAGYTDVHARWPAYNILFWIVLGCGVLLLINLWRRTWRWFAAGIAAWILGAILVGTIYPALVQNLRVRPSELDLERPYITYSIQSTLAAYGLDQVQEQDYVLTGTLTLQNIADNVQTIDNIRLWDHRPLYQTYGQLQEIRLYYDFVDIDVERYVLGGTYREVELAMRELSVDQLSEEAQRWVNRRLVYTHGYGVVLSPVNEICEEGQPCFLIRDIPPQSSYPELRLDRPEIYYGEDTGNYVIVHTTAQEFDYPKGDTNVYTTYQGSGGVPVGSLVRRLAFALRFGDINILVSGNLTSESRILYRRDIQERVEAIAPFLWYDYDPYPVILDGRIYWVQDAFTSSDRYPYAEPYQGLNYVRNAVKVVIDPYNGTTRFYIVDPDDPLIQTYARIFPGLFQPVEDMPAGLREHWRYPEDLFRIQTYIYATYHMRDPQVFYNKEDTWYFAKEIYEGAENFVDSYYVIMRLPNWEREEFFLMVPFTPANRDNMIAWMHAQCDGDDYGRLGVFKFPKQTLVYGPFQIEARIDQDTTISQQLSLWNQRGSQVLRGNLLVIPIDNSLLYVEPLYLQAEKGQIPELKRVTVAYGNRIAMAETLDQALRLVLSGETTVPEQRGWEELAQSAQEHYQRGQECLQAGDWACYGTEMQALEQVLQELVQLTEGP